MSFLTGSHAYGKPNQSSDIDIVIRGEKGLAKALLALPGVEGYLTDTDTSPGREATSVKIGEVNLIICHTDRAFQCWNTATNQCMVEAGVKGGSIDRDRAIEIHSLNRKSMGIA